MPHDSADPKHIRRRLTMQLLGAVAASGLLAALLIALYALAPEPTEAWTPVQFAVFGTIAAVLFVAVMIAAISRLARSRRPLLAGLSFTVVLATILVLSYSWLYVSLSVSDAAYFTEPLTKASAAYFTVTVLSTVGFGDITPVGDTARMVVTSQMVVGFTVITLAIRAVATSTQTAIRKKHAPEIAAFKEKSGYSDKERERPDSASDRS